MKIIRNVFVSFCVLVLGHQAFAGVDIMPVAQIKPGMRGVGKTVFIGTQIEKFDFEVLDIIHNFKPQRDLILVKLIGDKVQDTGVVAGMSGSPMYIDGKLIGALSYRMGIFLKDPIAGITPIEEMLEVFDQDKTRDEELAMNRGFNPSFLEMAVGATEIDWQKFVPPYLNVQPAEASASALVPLEIPLLFSGFEDAALQQFSRFFAVPGLKVQQGGGFAETGQEDGQGVLEPGSAYSVVIVDGDLGLQATGTVTYTDGDRVLGMGHPFLNSGAVTLPMGKAKILTTLSSLMASTKMAALTEIAGAVHQDRTTGVMGVSGEQPDMIPVRFHFKSKIEGDKEFRFRIAEDRSLYSLTPLIFGIVLTNALESARLSFENQTLKLDGKINLQNHEPILLQNYYAGSTPSGFVTDMMEATGDIASVVGALLSNNFEEPRIESVDLNFEALYKKHLATVQQIDVDKTVVKPGDKVTITVHVQEFQGQSHTLKKTIQLPREIKSNRVVVYAGSGSTLTQLEARTLPQKFRPKSFDQLVELLKSRRKNNSVFFQVRLRDKGVLIDGQELPALPPSILSVINSQKSSGNIVSLRDRVLIEDHVQVDYSISGGRTVLLKVEPKKD